ncbi:MAG TPA: methionine--tRNA ligase [Edaphobacter sp.]|nr:methionine--tRNA ligase [Edaphobacter sp.]
MSENTEKFYLTTPIYYVNARPHIGHAYTTIAADVIARRQRLLLGQDNVWFLTGTDEHGQKIERSAAAAGIPPQQFADQVSAQFESLWKRMGITNNQYIRTTDPDHVRGVQKLFNQLYENGHIYLDSYTGQYSVGEEMFIDGPPGTIGPDGKPTETVTEENFYFRLSAFQRPLIDLIESGTFCVEPEARRNEVLSFLRGDTNNAAQTELSAKGTPYIPGALKDLSISRSSFDWGIPVPEPAANTTQKKHVIYVWLDALANYMTAVGYGSDKPEDQAKLAKFWPADLHLVGKEIIRFHCVYWPAFLLAADLPLPKKVQAHGWLLFEESKMSKSRGNIVRTETILEAFGSLKPEASKEERDLFGSDVLRYFLLREIPFGQDGSFSFDALVQRYNSDLANGYGNLVSRTLSMIYKYFDGQIPFGKMDDRVGLEIQLNSSAVWNNYSELDFSSLLQNISNIIRAADQHITSMAPWKVATDETRIEDLKNVLYTAAESIRIVTSLIEPVLPYTSTLVFAQLGIPSKRQPGSEPRWASEKLGPLSPIFPRAPKELIEIMTDMEQNEAPKPTPSKLVDEKTTHTSAAPEDSTHPGAAPRTSTLSNDNPGAHVGASSAATPELPKPPAPHSEAPASGAFAASAVASTTPDTPQIAIDDFVKIDLRVAKIIVAERIPKADKLLRLEVDLGYEKRQILSGIAEWYTPEELLGKKIVVIANLAPRKMRGLESHGMLLAASHGENGKPILATFAEDIELGSRLK